MTTPGEHHFALPGRLAGPAVVEWPPEITLPSTSDSSHVDVAAVMADLQGRVRARLRERLAASGSVEFEDAEIFDAVARVFRRGLDARDRGDLLLPELLPDEEDWRVDTPLRLSTHRPLIGGVLLFVKTRVLLPLNRWLYEYTREHFRRQHQVNLALFACLESLAIENARLRQDVDALRRTHPASPTGAPRPGR